MKADKFYAYIEYHNDFNNKDQHTMLEIKAFDYKEVDDFIDDKFFDYIGTTGKILSVLVCHKGELTKIDLRK